MNGPLHCERLSTTQPKCNPVTQVMRANEHPMLWVLTFCGFDSVGVNILGPLLDPSNIEYHKSDKDMFRKAMSWKLLLFFFKKR